MLRYTTDRARLGLVTVYVILPGNGPGLFLQHQNPHGARGQSRSPNVVPLLGMVSYKCAIVTLSKRRTVFQKFDFKNVVTLKTGLGVRQKSHWKCHHSIERI